MTPDQPKAEVEKLVKRIESMKVEGNRVGDFWIGDGVVEFANQLLDVFKSKALQDLKSKLGL